MPIVSLPIAGGSSANFWFDTGDGGSGSPFRQTLLTTVPRVPALVTADQLTRPNDITAYAGATTTGAGDAISNSTTTPTARTFSNAALSNGGGGYITRAICKTSQTTMAGAIRLHLYTGSSAPTATNDNAAFTPPLTNYLGYIDFFSFSSGISAGNFPDSVIAFRCNGANANLYGLYEARTAFTPAALQTIDVDLWIDQV